MLLLYHILESKQAPDPSLGFPSDLSKFITALPPLKYYFEAIDILKASELEWTVFLNGVFLDYYGMPHIKTYLAPNVFAIDMVNKVAAIPGDGNTPVTFTRSMDLAKFVVAALDLPSWEEESRVVGDEVTFNRFVDMAEEVCGESSTCPFNHSTLTMHQESSLQDRTTR